MDPQQKIKDHLIAEAQQRLQKITELENSDAWVLRKTQNDTKVYSMKPESGALDIIKGETTVDCTVEEFHKFLNSGIELLKEVDKMFAYGSELKQIVPGRLVAYHSCFKAPGRPLISDRVFTYLYYDQPDKFCGVSFDTELYEDELDELGIERPDPQSGVVRAFLHGTAYFYHPVPGRSDQVRVVYVCQADVRGWIPSWVANITAVSQAMNVRRIAEYFMAKHGRELKNTGDKDEIAEAEAAHKGEDTAPPPGAEVANGTEHKKKKKRNKKKKNAKKGQEAAAAE